MAMFLITAPSGAGKTTIVNSIEKLNMWNECISVTTRPIRVGEVDGKTYYFMEESDFADSFKKGNFAEIVSYDGNHYGITHKEIERVSKIGKNVAIIVEYNGYQQLKALYPDAIGIFIYMSKEECLANMLWRGDKAEKAITRMKKYDDEMENRNEYDYVIKNVRESLSNTIDIIRGIIRQNTTYSVSSPKK